MNVRVPRLRLNEVDAQDFDGFNTLAAGKVVNREVPWAWQDPCLTGDHGRTFSTRVGAQLGNWG